MSIFALRSNSLASSAYKNLSRTQSNLNSNIGRLSSGLRINSTADDSAGSNVSVRMGNQVRGMSQANRNAQNANNLLATAESGLSDISDILSKMRELSVQASTDTLNDVDRASIDLEFQSLKDELTRIANVTEYNGMNVLNGTYQTAGKGPEVQVNEGWQGWTMQGAEVLGNDNVSPGPYGVWVHEDSSNTDGTDIDVTYWVDVWQEPVDIHGNGNGQYFSSHNQEPFDANVNGISLRLDPTQFPAQSWNNNVEYGQLTSGTITVTGGGVSGDGTVEGSETWAGTGPESLFNSGGNGYVGDQKSGVYDQAQPGTDGGSNPHGTNGPASVNVDGPNDNIRGHWRLQIGADNDINNQHEFSITNATANGLDLEGDNVLSVDNARTAITAIDHAIDEVNKERSYIGSEQNKLQFTMSNLTSNIQSIESSRSSIEDVDFAAEAADLAKNQILAQSGTAMLAQASAISQNILGLLA